MPITLVQHEATIYESIWHDAVTLTEIWESLKDLDAQLEEAQVEGCVVIINLTDATKLPYNLSDLQKIAQAEPRIIRFIAVRATIASQTLVRIFNRFSPVLFQLAISEEDAMEQARAILNHHNNDVD